LAPAAKYDFAREISAESAENSRFRAGSYYFLLPKLQDYLATMYECWRGVVKYGCRIALQKAVTLLCASTLKSVNNLEDILK
jgi:hypothetical protein